jgi:hypothetical protein
MPLYRCRFWDNAHNTFQMQVACENDAEAVAMARRMSANGGTSEFEVWQHERRVNIEMLTGAG